MFLSVRQVSAPVGRHRTFFGRDSKVAVPGRSPPFATASYFACCKRMLMHAKHMLNICKKMADNNNSCDSIAACGRCLLCMSLMASDKVSK